MSCTTSTTCLAPHPQILTAAQCHCSYNEETCTSLTSSLPDLLGKSWKSPLAHVFISVGYEMYLYPKPNIPVTGYS